MTRGTERGRATSKDQRPWPGRLQRLPGEDDPVSDHIPVEELADAAEGLLPSHRAAVVDTHLAGCASCRGLADALAEVTRMLADAPAPAMPSAVADRLDQVVAGDWDGDGSATVAVYRPSTGRVLYVDRFPAAVGQRVTAGRTTVAAVGGRAHVRRDGSGRPIVVVDPPG